MRASELLHRGWRATTRSLSIFARDVGSGMLEVSHNSLALLGLLTVTIALAVGGRAELRSQFEQVTLEWLQTRQEVRELASGDLLVGLASPDAVSRATAADLKELTSAQAKLAHWIARRYKVAPEPIGALVREAWAIGQRSGLDPTLILAVMAVESSFNPFAQSPVGAQGLMQVMTRVHDAKYTAFGGAHAAFDPITNLRVGVAVLRECIARAGSVQEGLRYYVGAALLDHDSGYAARVMLEQGFMRNVADGRSVAVNASNVAPAQPRPLQDEALAAPPAAAPASAPAAAPQQVALLR